MSVVQLPTTFRAGYITFSFTVKQQDHGRGFLTIPYTAHKHFQAPLPALRGLLLPSSDGLPAYLSSGRYLLPIERGSGHELFYSWNPRLQWCPLPSTEPRLSLQASDKVACHRLSSFSFPSSYLTHNHLLSVFSIQTALAKATNRPPCYCSGTFRASPGLPLSAPVALYNRGLLTPPRNFLSMMLLSWLAALFSGISFSTSFARFLSL